MKCTRRKEMFVLVALFIGVLISFLGAEAFFRWQMPFVGSSEIKFMVWQPNLRMEIRPPAGLFRGMGFPSRFTTNSEGVRGPERNLKEWQRTYSILCLGGSTTEMLFLDDSEVWTYLIFDRLKNYLGNRKPVWVGNAGKAGRKAIDNLLDMKYLVPQFNVKAVIIMVGVNDLLWALGGKSLMIDINNKEMLKEHLPKLYAKWSLEDKDTSDNLLRLLSLWKYYQQSKLKPTPTPLQVQLDAGEFFLKLRERRKKAEVINDQPDLSVYLSEYRRILSEMARTAKARKERLIFLTQPSIWRKDLTQEELDSLWTGAKGDLFNYDVLPSFYDPEVLASLLEQFNWVMLEVCREKEVECVDMASKVPKNGEMFFDDCHFTEAGSAAVAKAMVEYLVSHPE